MKLGILASNFQSNFCDELENSNLASNRLRLNIVKNVAQDKNILVMPLDFYNSNEHVDILIIGKFVAMSGGGKYYDDDGTRFNKWLNYIESSKKNGTKIILDYCDHLIIAEDIRSEFYRRIINKCDLVIAPSELMKKNISKHYYREIKIIEDPLEMEIIKAQLNKYEEINALWFGHATNLLYLLKNLYKLNELNTLQIVTNSISENDQTKIRKINKKINIKFYEWEKNFYTKYNMSCNVSLIPGDINNINKNGVSNNRLITSFALGLVPLVSPLESYREYSEYYINLDEHDNIKREELIEKNIKLIKNQEKLIQKNKYEIIEKKWQEVLK